MSRESRLKMRELRDSNKSFGKETQTFIFAVFTALAIIVAFHVSLPFWASAIPIWHFQKVEKNLSKMDGSVFTIVKASDQLYAVNKTFPYDVYFMEKTYKKPQWLNKIVE